MFFISSICILRPKNSGNFKTTNIIELIVLYKISTLCLFRCVKAFDNAILELVNFFAEVYTTKALHQKTDYGFPET
tara:strand:- start:1078 stop:1305 length:228 start_codon:yes stop_codon:yes gene_type:complete